VVSLTATHRRALKGKDMEENQKTILDEEFPKWFEEERKRIYKLCQKEYAKEKMTEIWDWHENFNESKEDMEKAFSEGYKLALKVMGKYLSVSKSMV
jgi:hypothetical protein